MHDINAVGFMDFSPVPIENYTLESFLYHECAVEKKTDLDKVMLMVASILRLLKFDPKLLGNNYLIYLVTRYLVKSDYNENTEIGKIAENCGTYRKVVTDNIRATIKNNPNFIKIASCAIPQPLYVFGEPSVSEVVAIVGTIYKLYYNYSVDSEHFANDDDPYMNYLDITFDNEKESNYE